MAMLKTLEQIMILHTLLVPHCSAAMVTERDRLYQHVFTDYNNKGFPVIDHTARVNIDIMCYLVAINNFDEISGELSLAMFFRLSWVEERISWNASEFGGIVTLLVSPDDIWLPRFFILQSSNRIQEIGNLSVFLRLYSDGVVYWTPANEFDVTCSVDVTYFPFDKQLCNIEFSGLVYDQSELAFYSTESDLDTSQMTNNSQWEVLPSKVQNCTKDRGSSCVEIHLSLRRKSEFYIVYIFVPLSFLGILNNLVFAMPASSGERNSVAVTTFLSFVVYMGIVNDVVPQSSSPLSYLYLYLMFLMVYSSTIMFLCIISLRIYNAHGNVPCLVKGIVILLRCRCLRYCKRGRFTRIKEVVQNGIKWCLNRKDGTRELTRHDPVTEDTIGHNNGNKPEPEVETLSERNQVDGKGRKKSGDVTWNHVGRTFDIFWLIILYMVYVLASAYHFIVLYLNIHLNTDIDIGSNST